MDSATGAVSVFEVTVTAPDGTTERRSTQQRYRVTASSKNPPGLVIDPTTLVMTEGIDSSYTVKLASRPSAAVALEIARKTGGDGEAEIRVGSSGAWGTSATLSFTIGNRDTPQTVSVRKPADSDGDDETDTSRTGYRRPARRNIARQPPTWRWTARIHRPSS